MGRAPRRLADRFIAAMNAEDADACGALMSEDIVYIDSQLGEVRGKQDCLQVLRAFFGLRSDFRIVPENLTTTPSDEVLIRGSTESSNERFRCQALWRAQVRDSKIKEWQSYRAENPPALARMLAPQLVR